MTLTLALLSFFFRHARCTPPSISLLEQIRSSAMDHNMILICISIFGGILP